MGVGVGVGIGVGVAVGRGVAVGLGVGVAVGIVVGTGVGAGVAVGISTKTGGCVATRVAGTDVPVEIRMGVGSDTEISVDAEDSVSIGDALSVVAVGGVSGVGVADRTLHAHTSVETTAIIAPLHATLHPSPHLSLPIVTPSRH